MPTDGGEALTVFEVRRYPGLLGGEDGLVPRRRTSGRKTVMEWLPGRWSAVSGRWPGKTIISGNMRPTAYVIERYVAEASNRPYGVLDRRLAGRVYLAGDDYNDCRQAASYPWVACRGNVSNRTSTIFFAEPTALVRDGALDRQRCVLMRKANRTRVARRLPKREEDPLRSDGGAAASRLIRRSRRFLKHRPLTINPGVSSCLNPNTLMCWSWEADREAS